MKYIADLHIHSKYSRATSKDMALEGIARWAKIKGIDVMATGDFTHPAWFSELKSKLQPAEPGFYQYNGVRFVINVEISSIYKKNDKVRKIHNLVFAPSIEIASKIRDELDKIGNIRSDGRPILGLDAEKLAEIVFNISQDCVIIPCHAWTPWFSIFGSKSGFDSIEECFGKYTDKIFAIETGLSSDPAMNWRLSQLDNISLISCSDAHSPQKLGREACVFDTQISYKAMFEAIKNKDKAKFLYTIEFFPEEGKYHYDGHRECKVCWDPRETRKHNGLCSVCGKKVTVGVLSRVQDLADRDPGFVPASAIPFKSIVPLMEIVSMVRHKGTASKAVQQEYMALIDKHGPEFKILLDLDTALLEKSLRQAIDNMRLAKLSISPGYDGEFGRVGVDRA